MTEPKSEALRAYARFRQLVDELGKEEGYRFGWKAAVARRLGVHPSFISKIVGNEITTISAETLEKARSRLSLRARFFLDDDEKFLGSYREYLGRNEGPESPGSEISKSLWRGIEPLAIHVRIDWEGIARLVGSIDYRGHTAEEPSSSPDEVRARALAMRSVAERVLALRLVDYAADVEDYVSEEKFDDADRVGFLLWAECLTYLGFIQAWDSYRELSSESALSGAVVLQHPDPITELKNPFPTAEQLRNLRRRRRRHD